MAAAARTAGGERIGELRSAMGAFSYYNPDPANIRNHADWGGGGLMDIGCYLIHASRYAFARGADARGGAD